MTTENNWLTHNLHERLENKNLDFHIKINVQKYNKLSFQQASKHVCEKLYSINKNIYIGLSGGIDSEYVFKRFIELNIPFNTIIVDSKCYKQELSVAFELCKNYNINPIILKIDEVDIIKQHKLEINDKLNSFGIGGVPALKVAEYVKNHDGIYIKAEHMIGDDEEKVCVEVNEWDFYNDVLVNGYTYDFFMYDPDIVYSMVSQMKNTNSQEFKCQLYNIPYRDKIKIKLSNISRQYFHHLVNNRIYTPSYNWKMNSSIFLEKYF